MLAPVLLAMFLAHTPVAGQATGSQQPTASVTQPTAEKPWPPVGVYLTTGGVTAPRLIKSGRPDYTAEAMRAKIQGTVRMQAVVKPDGTVGEVRVVQSLDRRFGLDESAVKSLKDYRWVPGTKDGVAVPVLVSIEIQFALK